MTNIGELIFEEKPFLAVDQPQTQITEDGFRYEEDKSTGKRTLSIIAVVPPENAVLIDGEIDSHIEGLKQKILGVPITKVPDFLTQASKKSASLSQIKPQRVLFASFSLMPSFNRGVKYTLEENFGFGQATVKYMTYEEFSHTDEIKKISSFLKDLLSEYPQVLERSQGESYRRTKIIDGYANWIVRILCELFNHACIKECVIHKVPCFNIRPNKESPDSQLIVSVDKKFSIFNKPLRNVFAYINSMNLFNFLNGRGLTFTRKEVLESFKPKT